MESPYRVQILGDIEKSIHGFLAITGMDMLIHSSFKKVFRFHFNIIQALLFCICDGYSFYQFRDNLLMLIFSLSVVGIGTQGVSIMFIFVIRSADIRQRYYEVKAYQTQRAPDPAEEAIKDRYCALMKRLCNIYLLVYTSLVTLNLLYSLIGRIFFDKRTLLFGLDMPFLDETVSPDYELVLAYQIVQDIYTWANIVSFQYFVNVLILHNCCLMDVLGQKMKGPWEPRSPDNWRRLLDILVLHQQQLDFFRGIQSIFNPYNTTQLICTTGTATVIAYILLFDVWIPGYVLLVLSLGMLFVNCIYGTFIEKKASELVVATFDTLDWTVLSPRERRLVVVLLRSAQNNTQLRCGGIFVINYHTFLTVSEGEPAGLQVKE